MEAQPTAASSQAGGVAIEQPAAATTEVRQMKEQKGSPLNIAEKKTMLRRLKELGSIKRWGASRCSGAKGQQKKTIVRLLKELVSIKEKLERNRIEVRQVKQMEQNLSTVDPTMSMKEQEDAINEMSLPLNSRGDKNQHRLMEWAHRNGRTVNQQWWETSGWETWSSWSFWDACSGGLAQWQHWDDWGDVSSTAAVPALGLFPDFRDTGDDTTWLMQLTNAERGIL